MNREPSTCHLLLERCSDAAFRIGSDCRYRYANPAASVLLGIDPQTIAGKPIAELGLGADMAHAWEAGIRAALASGELQTVGFQSNAGQRATLLHASVLPEFDEQGTVVSVLGIIHDLSRRQRMEREHEELLMRERSARVQAETAARARDEFLAIVSHELRAPLNGIQTWTHVLESQIKEARSAALVQRAIAGIKTGVSQQVRLIDDLLDVTRMMSGKLRLIKEPFALLPVVQAAVESIQDAASAKQITIECDLAIGDERIDGDADRIQQALGNLLSNAVKFTPAGGAVWVDARRTESRVAISVRDNGPGISREFLPLLFDRFSQEDTSSTRRHNGLGLGLFLVRHLIELHGGSVRAESAGEGQGASFSIELPLRGRQMQAISALAAEAGAQGESLPSLDGLCILLIDDQEEARESLSMVLEAAGASVFAAATSGQLFAWLESVSADRFPNAIISDIAMPDEDGYTVLRRLRGWQDSEGRFPLRRVPVLALTAFAQREDRIRALTAGFQMHLAKPVAPEELIVVVAMMAAAR